MINLKRLGHVFVVVRDIKRSKHFYTDILGFKVLEEDPEHGGVFMAIGDLSHTFDLVQSAEPNASGPPQGRPAKGLGVQHMAFLVEGRDELHRPYGRIRQGKRAIVLKGDDVAPGDVVNIRVMQATAGQLIGLRIPTNSEPAA